MFLRKNNEKTVFEKLVSKKHVLGVQAVSGPWHRGNRVRGGLLHILVVGNLWGMISNLFLTCVRTSSIIIIMITIMIIMIYYVE